VQISPLFYWKVVMKFEEMERIKAEKHTLANVMDFLM
jgi:hypothetical protein